ncbi:MAG: hypothetical protein NZT92_24050, partial [Abditibacteriales bacterium]|nr:hypothetical protein [Abditibacteriales bacterium]
ARPIACPPPRIFQREQPGARSAAVHRLGTQIDDRPHATRLAIVSTAEPSSNVSGLSVDRGRKRRRVAAIYCAG